MHLAKHLHGVEPAITLRIIGYCALPQVLKKLRSEIDGYDYITLTGGDQLVPHDEIRAAIAASDFGIVCYPPSRHTENSIPTKLYEYLAYRLPILLQNHPTWTALCAPSQAAITVDFEEPDPRAIVGAMASRQFYTRAPEGVWWDGAALVAALR